MRFYRLLLHLYPRGFLADYRHELCAVFAQRARERRRDHGAALAWLLVVADALADVVPNAFGAHRDMLRQDLRYAGRSLGRTPGFAVTAILLVALGVGANTAAFSLADFVFVRPLPYPDADRLVKVWQSTGGYGRTELSPALYRDWAGGTRSVFADFGVYTSRAMNLVGAAEPRRLEAVQVTPGVLPLVGVPALLGRVIGPADSARTDVVVLSHALWRSQFGGAADIVGRTVRLDDRPHTVLGVMPSTFRFPDRRVEAWTPVVFTADDYADRSNTYVTGIARVRRGVTVERARAALDAVAARVDAAHPSEDGEKVGATVFRLRDDLSPRARVLVLALCGAALCILLLACANLASLLLARTAHRARELAVRAALGAGRERLVRQLVTESVALALVGGATGVAIAVLGVPVLAHLVPSGLPIDERPAVDLRALALALGVVSLTALLFGVMPAARRGRGDAQALRAVGAGARAGGGRTQRLRAGLVVVEVAASVVLLVSSGLLVRAVWRIQSIYPGFMPERVLTARTALPRPRYDVTARRVAFYDRVLGDVRALPGVTAAAYVSGLPMRMTGGIWGIEVPGAARDASHRASMRFVTPQYFATLGVPVRRGRDVSAGDVRDAPWVAVVSESFARRHWPGADPLGRRFAVAFGERTVVGVVGDIRVRGREQASEPQVYLPYAQVPDSALVGYFPRDLVVRATVQAPTLLPAIRRAVQAADPEQPVSDVATLEEVVGAETAPRVTQLRLLAALSAIALLVAGVGIHGLLTFTVSRRGHELAVRRALGAQAGGIVGLVLREGMALALVGIAVGLALAYPAARAMGALLAGVTPADPATLASVAGLCFTMALAGCLRPALRAMRVEPLTVLRAE